MRVTTGQGKDIVETPILKEDKIRELISKIMEYELERRLLNETMKETKQMYIDDGILTKDEMKLLIYAIKLTKEDADVDKLLEIVKICDGEVE
jgi:hypothetical protein